jgi:beta-galactosidase
VQIENEYGSYGNDRVYLNESKKMYDELGVCSTYFTSDGPDLSMLGGGSMDNVLSVANFGSDPKSRVAIMRSLRPDEPFMCGEYWCGWFSHWGVEPKAIRDSKNIASDIEAFFDLDASFNIYMFHGGTNFGFMNGANTFDGPTFFDVTSYDYGSPLSEAGDRREMYYAIREVIERRTGKVPPLTAAESKKMSYGKVRLTQKAELFDNLDNIGVAHKCPAPEYMEKYGQDLGYILYRNVASGPMGGGTMLIDKVKDRANVYFNGEFKATYDNNDKNRATSPAGMGELAVGESLVIDILCENMGRTNYGPFIADRKGINSVRFGWRQQFGWTAYTLPMDNLDRLSFEAVSDADGLMRPRFYRGFLDIEDTPCDTFLRLDSFTKGFVTVNGFNLGRYWEIGPQQTLYVPAPMLKKGKNEIIVFESDRAKALEIEFVSEPVLDKLM